MKERIKMNFEFDKFVKDIETRKENDIRKKEIALEIAEQDRLRRLRSERYHERWQNRIVWER
jgi:hypothetical protein